MGPCSEEETRQTGKSGDVGSTPTTASIASSAFRTLDFYVLHKRRRKVLW